MSPGTCSGFASLGAESNRESSGLGRSASVSGWLLDCYGMQTLLPPLVVALAQQRKGIVDVLHLQVAPDSLLCL